MKDSLDEALLMSDRCVSNSRVNKNNVRRLIRCHNPSIIQGLVAQIIEDIGVLYKASEAVREVNVNSRSGGLPIWVSRIIGSFARHVMVFRARLDS